MKRVLRSLIGLLLLPIVFSGYGVAAAEESNNDGVTVPPPGGADCLSPEPDGRPSTHPASGQFRIVAENDAFDPIRNQDRYYTNGLMLHFMTAPRSELLDRWLNKITDRENSWFSTTINERSLRWGLSLSHLLYTPSEINPCAQRGLPLGCPEEEEWIARVRSGQDRPHAAWGYLSYHLELSWASEPWRGSTGVAQTGIEVAVGHIGSRAIGGTIQRQVHEFGRERENSRRRARGEDPLTADDCIGPDEHGRCTLVDPIGWDDETMVVEDKIGVNVNARIERPFLDFTREPFSTRWGDLGARLGTQLNWEGALAFGNVFLRGSLSLTLRLGLLPSQISDMGVWNTGLGDRSERAIGAYILARSTLNATLLNAFLADPFCSLSPEIGESYCYGIDQELGAAIRLGLFHVFYTYKLRTSEFNSGATSGFTHRYGTVGVSLFWD